MKSSSKGFTLVEMLATIILLGIVATIVIFNMTQISKNSKAREYEAFRAAVISGAQAYASANGDVFSSLYTNKSYMFITTGDVIRAGFLDENLKNPYTNERIGKDELIKVLLDTATGALRFEYPGESTEDDDFLVALDDYVIFGEPYDCMTGLGTYKLAISNSNGDLISKEEALNNKHLTCSYEAGWRDLDESRRNVVNESETISNKDSIKYPDGSGTYKVKYTFLTEHGSLKEATRNVMVLDTFEPGFELKAVSNVSQNDFNNAETIKIDESTGKYQEFTPIIGDDCSSFTYLVFKPSLIGADTRNSNYTLTRTINLETGKYVEGTSSSVEELANKSTEFDKIYTVRDGDNDYRLDVTTKGHYFIKYKLDSSKDVNIVQDIRIPSCKISGQDSSYDTNRTININEPYNTQGILRYEILLNRKDENTPEMPLVGINKADDSTPITFSSLNNEETCYLGERTYTNAIIRAVNNEGFISDWSDYININITNKLYDILDKEQTGNEEECNTKCYSETKYSNSLKDDISCSYCSKYKYIKNHDNIFYILGRTNNEIIIGDESIHEELVDSMETKDDTWVIEREEDEPLTQDYQYTDVKFEAFTNAINDADSKLNQCPSDIYVQKTFGTDTTEEYTAYTGLITYQDYTNIFKNALTPNFAVPMSGGMMFELTMEPDYLKEVENKYYYFVNEDGDLEPLNVGDVKDLRTYHLIDKNNSYICSGEGTDSSPYVLASSC